MSAVNIVCQKRHRRVQIVADAASYDKRGVVHCFGTKLFPVSHWPGIVTGRGTALCIPLIGQLLSWEFASFDDVVDGLEEKLPGMIDRLRTEGSVELLIAGFSKRHDEPQAFIIETSNDAPIGLTVEERDAGVAAGKMIAPPAYQIQRLPDDALAPFVDADVAFGTGWWGMAVEAPPHVVLSALRQTIEVQRQQTSEGLHLVGGWVEHAVVTPETVSLQVIDRWSEDRVGELIRPKASDWTRWPDRIPVEFRRS